MAGESLRAEPRAPTAPSAAGDEAGLGVDIDEGLAAKTPYERAYVPVDRLDDGTMWNW